ncbi:MAG: UvrD-helicase domain-containing protein [Candidatus Binataceae bacterium]
MNAATPKLADQAVRDQIRRDLDTTIVIEAAAGTGKTSALVSRIVSTIASGRGELAHIVAVTFTEKAAGELKLRLREEIERARKDSALDGPSRVRLNGALPQLEEARIGTIHSFCADLLRERPVEARVDPMFEVAAEDSASAMFDAAFERWFESALAQPGEAVRRLLRRRDAMERQGPRAILRNAAQQLLDWRDFETPWKPQSFVRDREIDELIGEIAGLGRLAREAEPDDWLGRSLDEVSRPVAEAIRLESVRDRDYDALEAVLLKLPQGRRWGWKGFGGGFGGVERETIFARRDALRKRLEQFRENAGANLAPELRRELWPIIGYYEDIKRRAGALDFLDLLLVARNLVRDQPAVRAELQRRYTHIFVDEFQDTDPLQAEIIMLLAAGDPADQDWTKVKPIPGKLFIVGDPKQSIYRFRRADVALYQSVKRRLVSCGATLGHLTVSFRSTPALQTAINAAFAPLMAIDGPTHPAYAPLEPSRADCDTQPALVALPVPAPYGDFGRVTDWRIEESLPDAIAAYVRWLVNESGWTVTEREAPDRRTPIRPRHICILFRRLNSHGRDVTRSYLRALEARHLPHVLVKGGSFNEREEVEAIRNLLAAVERPDDDLVVFATLRGPIFALSDDLLLEFHETVKSLNLFRPLPDDLPERLAPVVRAREILRELHRKRNRRPIAETIADALALTRAHAGIAIWPTGDQALANIMRLMDQARRYEARRTATSFRGFVDELEERAERDEAGETPLAEEGTEGVRIMTVHRAKGLEFPVVILADITCKETVGEPSRYVDPARGVCALRLAGCSPRELLEQAEEERRRDEEEAIRLLYVATTRARDLLVVPVLGDEKYEGWVGRLNPVVYPAANDLRSPLSKQPPGCPEFGEDSVQTRPSRAPGRTKSVAPGLHRPAQGAHQVTWWDPSRLILDVKEAMGLRQSKLLETDDSGAISNRGKELHEQWRARRDATLAAGAVPTLRVATATAIAHETPATGTPRDAIRIEETRREAGRPNRAAFGQLVHETMLRVPFGATAEQIGRIAAYVARMIATDDADAEAAAVAVERALESPAMRAAAAAARVHREYPILFMQDDGTLVEGIADLAFESGGNGSTHWTVVDFKTDRDLTPHLDEYRAQLGLYIEGIRKATGSRADGIILWI